MLLSEFIELHLRHAENEFSRKTFEVYKYAFSSLLGFTNDIPIESITPLLIERFKISKSRDLSPSTINMILRALRAAFERARVTFDLIEKNPLSKVKQIRTPDKRAAYLTVDDIQRLLSSMCREKWLRDIVVFVCNTGLRLGELINLRWENVDLRNKVIRIESDEQYRVKMGKSRIIPLNQKTAYRILKEKSIDKKNSVYVFTSKKGAKVNPFFLSKKFKHYVRLAGLGEEIHFHSLRHTFASLLAQSAVPLYDIKELLGHSQISVTEKYSHLSTESMRRAVEQVPVIKSSPQSIATFLKDAKLKSLREPRSRIDLSKKSSKEKLGQQELTFE